MDQEAGNLVVCVKERERSRRAAMTGSVPTGQSGLHGPSAAHPVAREREPDRGPVMDQTSESVMRDC